ncbi:MAG TPA: S-methyl-5-thioribose-1-phosphate isomerase [Gemmatimonadaceae bacterium]|nr:S-methyl-5-thioribose-1-phosphate isomerase [Gemmatimonadaceae bacterium]
MEVIEPITWSQDGHGVRILDQRELPEREVYRDLRTVDEVYDAIRTLAVRGAPAIGIAGAMGVTLALDGREYDRVEAGTRLGVAAARLRSARPTAVNLAWAIDRVESIALRHRGHPRELPSMLRDEATRILEEDRAMCRRIGEHGASLIPDGARILTHCNAGALATGGMGTALAAIYVAREQGKKLEVYADETRPLLQGSRLTAWELHRAGIPVTVLVDGAAASLMRDGEVDLCIVGADRIAVNGDVANKIGTYQLAIAAKHHGVPFYVAAPASTFDATTRTGDEILIEQRDSDEVRRGFGTPTAPSGVAIHNPAFDVTPAALITAIVSDRGVHEPPFHFA